jgi:hypothetical protein
MRESRTRETEMATRWGVVVAAILAAVIAAGHVGKLPPALRRPTTLAASG